MTNPTTQATISMFKLFADFIEKWKKECGERGIIPTADELAETVQDMISRLESEG